MKLLVTNEKNNKINIKTQHFLKLQLVIVVLSNWPKEKVEFKDKLSSTLQTAITTFYEAYVTIDTRENTINRVKKK